MMSRSHQGIWSPPEKKEPMESKNLLIFTSIRLLMILIWFLRRRFVEFQNFEIFYRFCVGPICRLVGGWEGKSVHTHYYKLWAVERGALRIKKQVNPTRFSSIWRGCDDDEVAFLPFNKIYVRIVESPETMIFPALGAIKAAYHLDE